MTAIQQKNWQGGLDALSRAALVADQTAFLWEHLGLCAVNLEKYEAAFLHTTRLLWCEPNHVLGHLNRGRIAVKLQQIDDAIADFEWVMASDQAKPETKAEAGIELIALYRDRANNRAEMKAAFDAIARVEQLPKESIKEPGRFFRHRIFTYLKAGDYKKGFAYYEQRSDKNIKLFSQPIWMALPHHRDDNCWDGVSSLKDKSILVAGEQGLGDVMQFARFLPLFLKLLEKQKARVNNKAVKLEVYPELAELLQGSPICKDITVVARGADVGPFDLWVKLGSLPHYLDVTIDNIPFADKKSLPYITPALPPRPQLMAAPTRRKVGLCWSSNMKANDNQLRSVPSLRDLLPLWDAELCDFYSLQMGPQSKEIETIGMEAALLDLSPYINTMADTARFIHELDLLITIDTSVFHLAGAMGKPVWVLAPYASDWRLGLGKPLLADSDGKDDAKHGVKQGTPFVSPWYPTSRIFRAAKPGEWYELIEALRDELVANKW
ncbi:MAG: tetratricopeptide repeat-containing glycosyltransferase family protein, partial [Alphaproteobacteria bacterium]|nr:tetratricopeptide repeat-containing glycosyltransferase family protein [Alphaproteobacteria bacterium]